MFGQLNLIRAFEEVVLQLAGESLVHGPAHSSIGQEGGAVGSLVGARPTDSVNGSHRGHHQFLAKALSYVAPDGLTLDALATSDIQTLLQRSLAEILGLAQDSAKVAAVRCTFSGMKPVVWDKRDRRGRCATRPRETLGLKKRAGTSDLTVTYFGDGAVNIGSVLESMNLTSAWDIPLVFFIENNLYAVSTTVDEATRESRLSGRGVGFGIPSLTVDGMDPLAVYLAMQHAESIARNGGGPVVIEAEVYRFFHQNGPFPGSAFGYRSKEEEEHWRSRDPLLKVANEMILRGLITQEGADQVRVQAVAAMKKFSEQLLEPDPEGKEGSRRIRPELWPPADYVDFGVRSDASELAGVRTEEIESFSGELKDTRFVDAIANTIDRAMEKDSSIVILGEDVHKLKGGTNGATKGIPEKYPERILGTPISENAFAGLAGGMALDGRFRPIVEFMYPDFMWVAADQVFNQIGKARHMFGGEGKVPLVLRTKVAMGSGYGSQHLMDLAG